MSETNNLPPLGVLRIVDAEANRAAEGLRVVEDYVRFVLDDRHLTEQAKQLRHDLTAVLEGIATADRLAVRESSADVGAEIATAAEGKRADAASVAAASFKRVQQALRALEEYTKLFDGVAARTMEALRYRLYTLERCVGITADALGWLTETRLYVLVDCRQSESESARLIETLVAAGVDAIQLRDKRLDDRGLLNCARRLREVIDGTSEPSPFGRGQVSEGDSPWRRSAAAGRGEGAGNIHQSTLTPTLSRKEREPVKPLFIMNDRPDLAVLSRADGVHVGQDELSVKDTRSIVGPKMLIGVSTHSLEQARQAVEGGANYIGVGPTFPSETKSFDQFTGVELLKQVAAEVRLPAFAIGGVTRENLPQVMAAGIRRVAVSGAVINAAHVKAAVAGFQEALRTP